MQKYLVFYRGNWADEMGIEGYTICSQGYKDCLENEMVDDTIEKYVGTNEYIDLRKSDYSFKEISDEEIEVLKRLGILSFGHDSPFWWSESIDLSDEELVEWTEKYPGWTDVGVYSCG